MKNYRYNSKETRQKTEYLTLRQKKKGKIRKRINNIPGVVKGKVNILKWSPITRNVNPG